VTPDGEALTQLVDDYADRLAFVARRRLDGAVTDLERVNRRLGLASPARAAARDREKVRQDRERLTRAVASRLSLARAGVDGLGRRLVALSPEATLARGYAHVRRRSDGVTVRATRDARPGAALVVRVADGSFEAVVPGQPTLFDLEATG
jgi:exodeoxyribonuclease VII large subunit